MFFLLTIFVLHQFTMGKTTFNRIKSVLAEKDKTNKDLADALHIAPETVSSWCTNSAQPSIKRLFDIAKYLDVEVRILLVSTKSQNN
jgi:transcriptional regulator with XRE-family HTH domain